MKSKILTLGVVLALVAVLVMPMTALAEGQTVTGKTYVAYTITTSVDFGNVPPSSSKTITGVVTCNEGARITISVANTTSGYTTGVLTKLEYYRPAAADVAATITAPGTSGADKAYVVTYTIGSNIFMLAGNTLDLTAYTGATVGTWDPVVITLTVGPP